MLLHADPSLAEVPGFSTEQLESLTRSVELKKLKLEADITEYIARKQRDLRQYEQELLEEYRRTERASTPEATGKISMRAEPQSQTPAVSPHSTARAASPAESSAEAKKLEDKAKRTKHTRVHKREKELCGLVTPIFLPLLDAGDTSPSKKEKEKKKKRHKEGKIDSPGNSPPNSEQAPSSRDGEKGKETHTSRSKNSEERMERVEEVMSSDAPKDNQKQETGKKAKRPAVKKSSMRHKSDEKRRRKRVSLVIDDQIVLPAEEVREAALMSPSETTVSSASNSTTSLEDMLDPRLVARHDTPFHEHRDPVHHSLPLPMHLPSTSPTKHVGHTLPESPVSHSPPTSPVSPRSPRSPLLYELPQTATRTFLDPSPPNADLEIPQYASAAPIYADEPELAETVEEEFSTYVGGLSGSGVDNVDQTGSFGYPSSLGASYLESYMQTRPLSVRMAAAEKAGLQGQEKERMIKGRNARADEDVDLDVGKVDDVDDDEVMGSMEGL
ncbi:hypothetical protein BU26DRAFT_329736 [Trematosphaeria pertusa]|uniref:Tymo-45kd-70kd multi-domain protein n=1 Tax=Trematosphaeria pertusa TaxID=390896 RepID=A0A6A6IFC7_9PLEO|nr:uncharacterized protein BU26DRAFT_329736 [Trematosphaeria pertusa]KAF2248230.1 hypothetical protein BU26DRAFT_329736 [Trematosphaeria pertusa]